MNIDLSEIQEIDPMSEGPAIRLQADLIMNTKLKTFKRINFDDDGEQLASNEVIHVKVLTTGSDDMGGNIHIELTSEEDLFFHYKCE